MTTQLPVDGGQSTALGHYFLRQQLQNVLVGCLPGLSSGQPSRSDLKGENSKVLMAPAQ